MKKIWEALRIQDKVVAILLLLLLSIFGINATADWYSALTPEHQISSIVRAVIADIIKEQLTPLKIDIQNLNDNLLKLQQEFEKINYGNYKKILKDIIKQSNKLKNNQNDIYLDDFEYLLDEWENIPTHLKTPRYVKIIDDMTVYYYNK